MTAKQKIKQKIKDWILDSYWSPASGSVSWDDEKKSRAIQQANYLTDSIWELLLPIIMNPPKHDYWGAGELDCPPEIKASNGELHSLQCKVCGETNPKSQICISQIEKK